MKRAYRLLLALSTPVALGNFSLVSARCQSAGAHSVRDDPCDDHKTLCLSGTALSAEGISANHSLIFVVERKGSLALRCSMRQSPRVAAEVSQRGEHAAGRPACCSAHAGSAACVQHMAAVCAAKGCLQAGLGVERTVLVAVAQNGHTRGPASHGRWPVTSRLAGVGNRRPTVLARKACAVGQGSRLIDILCRPAPAGSLPPICDSSLATACHSFAADNTRRSTVDRTSCRFLSISLSPLEGLFDLPLDLIPCDAISRPLRLPESGGSSTTY